MTGAINSRQHGFDAPEPRAAATAPVAHQRLIRGERTASGAADGYVRSSGASNRRRSWIGH